MQDIWMLLSGSASQMSEQLDRILDGYCQFYDFDYSSKPLIEPLRSLRMLHHCAWIAKRWEDPAFPRCFPWFNSPTYWQQQLENFKEQLSLLE
jgi:Ser/Thr protein kinase RdoA (MazF antagonist)